MLKRMWIVLVILGLVAVVGLGVFFVFGDEVLEAVAGDGFFSGNDYSDDEDVDDVGLVEGDESFVSGEDSSGGGSGGGDSDVYVCPTQPVQYSLSNFMSDAECLVYGVGVCERVKMVCSAELHNLDYETGGLFGVEYSVTSGDEVLEVRVIEADVGPRGKSIFRAEIFMEGEFDVSVLGCSTDMDSVPKECI